MLAGAGPGTKLHASASFHSARAVPVERGAVKTMLRVLLAALLSFASLASVSASWTLRATPGSGGRWYDITMSSNGTKLAATDDLGKIWTSTDSGETWTSRATTQRWHRITSSSDGTKLAAFVGGWQGGHIWTSADSGKTWTQDDSVFQSGLAGAENGSDQHWTDITMSNDGTKIAATTREPYRGVNFIWISKDSGANFEPKSVRDVAERIRFGSITMSSNGTKLAATVSQGSIWMSTDSGKTWVEDESVGSPQDWRDMTSSSDGTKLAAVAGISGTTFSANIWISTDSGANWYPAFEPDAENWNRITSSSDGTTLAAVAGISGTTFSANIWISKDSGANWYPAFEPDAENWYALTMSSDGTKLAATVWSGNIWTFKPLVCDENSHVSNGACVPCGPGASRAQGDPIDGGDTECACVKDYYVSNGACVPCDPALGRAPGDVPSNGDTECECRCKARTRAWGFTMSD